MTPEPFEVDDMIYRWWITPDPERDAYALVIIRYRRIANPAVDLNGKIVYPPGEYLSSDGEWVAMDTWLRVFPWLRIDGERLNPFFGAPDWREAVASVIQAEILPHITALLTAMPVAAR